MSSSPEGISHANSSGFLEIRISTDAEVDPVSEVIGEDRDTVTVYTPLLSGSGVPSG